MPPFLSHRWTTDPEYIDLLNYVIGRTEDVESPVNIQQLAREFKEKSGNSQTEKCLVHRIERLRENIHNLKQVDTNTKVKLLFALSASVNSDFLEELKKNALVEVDEKNRITYYKANDGCLELKIYQNLSAKNRISNFASHRSIRSLLNSYLDDKNDSDAVPESKKEKEMKDRCREVLNEIKGEEDIRLIQAIDQQNQFREVPIKTEYEEPVEAKPKTTHNSKIKFFQAMQSLILCLDTPSLSWIQSEIQQKIQKLKASEEVILNSKIVLTFELLIVQITTHSVLNLSENVESVNLSNFLCYLKSSILNSKMSGMEGLVKKVNKLIEDSQNKRIPMETVTNAFSDTLDVEGF